MVTRISSPIAIEPWQPYGTRGSNGAKWEARGCGFSPSCPLVRGNLAGRGIVNERDDVDYRLKLSEGFLAEAEQDGGHPGITEIAVG